MHQILDFLTQLGANNSRERMHAHQPTYKEAKTAVLTIAKQLIDRIGAFDDHITDIEPAETMFRLAKDTRFGKDKSPYKTNFGLVIAPGGKKSIFPCYYLHLQPGNHSFIAGGLYHPEPEFQHAIREKLVIHRKTLLEIIDQKAFVNVRGSITGESYKRVPLGYPKEHPAIDLIKHKDRISSKPLSDKELLDSSFIENIIQDFQLLMPFNRRLHDAIVIDLKNK